MGRISTGTGLFSGLNTTDIISKLLALEARPRDLTQARMSRITTIKASFLGISAKLLTAQSSAGALKSAQVLDARTATSSQPGVLTATAAVGAVLGSTQFRAVQQAQAQRLISSGFADLDSTPVGAGTITIKEGGFVQRETQLNALNGGAGVPLGRIRLTNRAGTQGIVDLTTARSINDVVLAINNAPLGITASLDGDRLILTDTTGQNAAQLSVQELDGGSTAAALGLTVGAITAGSTLTGADVIKLTAATQLSQLNDGNGVRRNLGGDDLRISLRNGTDIEVSLTQAATIQDVLTAINSDSQNNGQLLASLSGDGKRIMLTDSTVGVSSLNVTALNGSLAAGDLGLLGMEQGGGVLTGERRIASFNSVLIRELNGGSGVELGTIELTDRSGAFATLDLSQAASLSDVVQAINGTGLGINAQINSAGNRLVITDTTGSTASNLIIADSTGSLAIDLGIAVNAATSSHSTGDLNHRYLSESTRLDRLNGGTGVQPGKIRITNGTGQVAVVDLSGASVKTLGDVIQRLNSSGIGILASLNTTGDGLLVTDTSGGPGSLTIAEEGGRTAADLKLLGSKPGAIDGAFRTTITLTATDNVNDLFNKMAASGAPVNVSTTNDGSALNPFRFILGSTRSGEAGRLLIDTGTTGLNFSTLAQGADALLQIGASGPGSSPVLFASSSNRFSQVIAGVDVELLGTSADPITVTVAANSQSVKDTLQSFVNDFNSTLESLTSLTRFDSTTSQRGLLLGDSLALQIESMLTRIASRSYGPADGTVRSLSDVGIRFVNGRLELDAQKLTDQLANNGAAVQAFLKTPTTGFADVVQKQLEDFTDFGDGFITQRNQRLDDETNELQGRIDLLNVRLSARQARLQAQFLAMEQALAALQSQQTSLASLANLATFSGGSNNR